MPTDSEFLVFIESNTTTGRLFASRARFYGYKPIVFSNAIEKFAYLKEDNIEARQVDTSSSHAIQTELAALKKCGTIRGIGTSTDWGILEAALAAQALGLPGPDPEIIRLCRDKAAQRALLKRKAKDDVHQITCRTAQNCYEAAQRIGKPVVVKPVAAAGSIGVRYCTSPSDALEHANTLLSLPLDMRRKDEFLVEEAILGPQFSLEIFNGALIGIVRQHYGNLPFFVASGHDFPAQVSIKVLDKLENFASMIIKEFRLTWGPVHVEVRLNQETDQIVLIEVNPRLAGAYVPELIRYTCGIDLIDLTIRNYLGLTIDPISSRTSSFHGVMRFFMTKESSGIIPSKNSNPELSPLVKESVLYIAPGTELKKANDYRDRYGHVIAVASTYDEAEEAANKLVSQQNISTLRTLQLEGK
ncbi:ATP-grasp domain-containing protein [Alcaligenes faecalis]